MKRRMILMVLFVLMLLSPGLAVAQTVDTPNEGFTLRVGGDFTVATDSELAAVMVVDGNATVQGTVTDLLFVIDGEATVDGAVEGDIVIVDGTLHLGPGATVNDVTLVSSTLNRADGATITGDVTEENDLASYSWGWALFSAAMWLGVTLVLVLAALVFAYAGGRQLTATGEVLRERWAPSIITGIALFVGLPFLAVLSLFTIIGIPLGITILLVVMPALWVLGYLVTGTWIGRRLTDALGWMQRPERPLLASAIGVFLLQIIGLIPALGPAVTLLAGMLGAGALVYRIIARPRAPIERQAVAAGPEPAQS
jgi:hypothetical protein